MNIVRIAIVFLLFITIVSSVSYSEEYWTGTGRDDYPAAIVHVAGFGYYIVWESSGCVYVTHMDYYGNIIYNREINVTGRSLSVNDAFVNDTTIYVLAGDLDNSTRFYIIKYDASATVTQWVIEYSISAGGPPLPSKPRSIVVNGSNIYALIENGDYATVLNTDPNGAVMALISYNIVNGTYVDMVNDNANLYIAGSTYYLGNYYAIVLVIPMSTFWPANLLAVRLDISDISRFIRSKSIGVDKYSIYLLVGIGAGPGPGLHEYMGIFRYKRYGPALSNATIYMAPGYNFGFDENVGNKLAVGDTEVYVVGYIVNQTNVNEVDIYMAGFDKTTVNLWSIKWNSTIYLEKGVCNLNYDNYVINVGFSPSHTGVFKNVTLAIEGAVTTYETSLGAELSEFAGTTANVSFTERNLPRIPGRYDIVVLSISSYGIPKPIPENVYTVLAASLLVIIVLAIVIYRLRRISI